MLETKLRPITCPTCKGEGRIYDGTKVKVCQNCQGNGVVYEKIKK